MNDTKHLDIEGAHQFLLDMGFVGLTLRQVRRWAGEKRLPFFRLGRKLYIQTSVLVTHLKTLQHEAKMGGR